MATRMQQRRGTAAQWTDANPILASGEIGFETDTGKFKIGDGVNQWGSLTYFVDGGALADLVDGAPALLDTLNELAAAIGDDPAFFTTVATNLSNHESDTTNVHGIADTSVLATVTNVSSAVSDHTALTTGIHGIADTAALATKTYADDAVSTHNSDTTNVHGIADTSVLATSSDVSTAVSDHNLDTTNVHGIADTAELETQTGAQAKADNALTAAEGYADSAVSAHNDDTTGVHGIADTSALATKAGTEVFENKTISYTNNTITVQVNNVSDLTASAAEINVLDGITASTAELNILTGVTATSAEINLLDGVTATTAELNILDGVTATAQEINTLAGITADTLELNILDGVTATTAEINHLSGVTSAIQTQLNALDTDKADLAGATFTGDVTVETNLTIDGNLTVSGTTTTVNTQDLVVSDPMIYMGEGNTGNLVDLGFVSSFNDGTYQHTGLVRDASAGTWKLFKGVTDEPTTVINFAQGTLDDLAVNDLNSNNVFANDVTANTLYYGGITGATSVQAELEKKTPELYTFTTESGTSKTLSLSDKFASLRFTSNSAVTVTVPTNASVALPVGSYIELYQWGTGQLTVVPGDLGSVFIRSTDAQTKTRTQYSAAVLIKVDTNEWLLTGDLTA